MIVVTGTQRSGTSLMSRFIKECGYNLGTDWWDDRIDGGLENPDVCNFFRDIIGSDTFPFTKFWEYNPQKTFHSFIHDFGSAEVVKFSYLLMNPGFVSQWFTSRGNNDKFIVMYRDAKAVVRSKESRPEFAQEDWEQLNMSPELLGLTRSICLKTMEYYGMEYVKVPFPIKSPADAISKIEEFTGLELSMKVWNNIFDQSKIHF